MKTEAARESNRRYSERNKEQLKQNNLRYREAHPEMCVLRAAKNRAQKRNIKFNLELEDIDIPKVCPILGIELAHNRGSHGGKDSSPSLDRINPELGYLKGNVQIISFKANMMKSSASPQELKAFANWINKTYD